MNYKDYLKEKQQRVVTSIDERIVNEDMVTVADAQKACEMAVYELAEQLNRLSALKALEMIGHISLTPVEP